MAMPAAPPAYTLTVILPVEFAQAMKAAGRTIALGRWVNETAPAVVWVTIEPLTDAHADTVASGTTQVTQVKHRVTWTDAYGLYAAAQAARPGRSVRPTSFTERQVGGTAVQTVPPKTQSVFNDFGLFEAPEPRSDVRAGAYRIANRYETPAQSSMCFGLSQAVTVNDADRGMLPINQARIPAWDTVDFAPMPTVSIWMESLTASAAFATDVESPATQIGFAPDAPAKVATYNPAEGTFETAPDPSG